MSAISPYFDPASFEIHSTFIHKNAFKVTKCDKFSEVNMQLYSKVTAEKVTPIL